MMPVAIPPGKRLVFLDTETTGLDPAVDRILEIGVVTVDDGKVEEWSSLLDPGTPRARSSRLLQDLGADRIRELPRFREVAEPLLERLADGLLIAHNARFDYTFLKAEFDRIGIRFEAQVVCSLTLSRKLYGRAARHDLASLVERHGLCSAVRHRALSDAQAIFQLWQTFHRDHSGDTIDAAIRELLAGPMLPAGLDPALIDRLPDKPGVYVLHANGAVLHVGRADNLRLRLLNYFRLDRISKKTAGLANAVENITWKATGGALGARLQRELISRAMWPSGARAAGDVFSWRFDAQAFPPLALTSLSDDGRARDYRFGLFPSERKARNALSRLAARHDLCRTLLEVPRKGIPDCAACSPAAGERRPERLRHLTRAYAALLPWKIEPWPYSGPIAIRERRDLHVVDEWRYLGTARGMDDIHSVLQARQPAFDAEIYSILVGQLDRVARGRILELTRHSK